MSNWDARFTENAITVILSQRKLCEEIEESHLESDHCDDCSEDLKDLRIL